MFLDVSSFCSRRYNCQTVEKWTQIHESQFPVTEQEGSVIFLPGALPTKRKCIYFDSFFSNIFWIAHQQKGEVTLCHFAGVEHIEVVWVFKISCKSVQNMHAVLKNGLSRDNKNIVIWKSSRLTFLAPGDPVPDSWSTSFIIFVNVTPGTSVCRISAERTSTSDNDRR